MAKTNSRKQTLEEDRLIRMLKTKSGADVATISEKLGWQPHTTRAAMTDLRKSGHNIAVTKPESGGVSRYRIDNTAATVPTTDLQDAG